MNTRWHIIASMVVVLAGGPGCSAIVNFDRSQIGADGSVDGSVELPDNRVETPDGTLVAWVGGWRAGNVVVGWATFEDDGTPVELEVVNQLGDVVGSGTADIERPDVVDAGFSDHPEVGYQIQITGGVARGDELRVRLAGTSIDLPNNPTSVR